MWLHEYCGLHEYHSSNNFLLAFCFFETDIFDQPACRVLEALIEGYAAIIRRWQSFNRLACSFKTQFYFWNFHCLADWLLTLQNPSWWFFKAYDYKIDDIRNGKMPS